MKKLLASILVLAGLAVAHADLIRVSGGGSSSGTNNPTTFAVTAQSGGSLTASTQQVIAASATITGLTITLPSASANGGKSFVISKVDISTMPVVIQAAGSDLISGTGTVRLNGYNQSAEFVSDGASSWLPIGQGIQWTPPYIGEMWQSNTASSINTASTTACNLSYSPVPVIVDSITVHVTAVGTGNTDVGVYDTNGKLLGSNGGGASATLLTLGRANVPLSTRLYLPPGNYWLCMVNSDVSTTYASTTVGTSLFPNMINCSGINYPLPASLTFPCTGARTSKYGIIGHVVGGATQP